MAEEALTKNQAKSIGADGRLVTSHVSITALHNDLKFSLEPRGTDPNSTDRKPAGSPASSAGFARPLGRVVMNLKLAWRGSGSPPSGQLVTLKVDILQADVDRVPAGATFELGWWDKNAHKWEVLKSNIPRQVQTVEVGFSKLGDPAIGLAP